MLETAPAVASETLIDVRDLKMHFPLTQGILFQRVIGHVRAVDGISFSIERGKTMGLVGESGSGKTTIGRTMVRLYKPTSGNIFFGGQDLATLKGEELRQLRRRVQMVFQDPFASLNPRFSVGSLIAEPMHIYRVAPRDEMTRAFGLHLNRLRKWLADQPNFAVLRIRYADVVVDTASAVERVNGFLGGRLDPESARTAVDPSLYRNKKPAAGPVPG